VPEEVKIKLEIFDSKEEKVKTLVDEIKESGAYQVQFNPIGFDEGVYLYQLTAGNVVITKTMTLIK